MASKSSLVLCATVLLVQSVYSACFGGMSAPFGYSGFKPKAFDGIAASGCGYTGFAASKGYDGAGCGCGSTGVASTGGGLPVASTSPIAPVGISVVSENAYEGTLNAGGNLPFVGGVAVEGVLPTSGAGAVSYGCGDGAIGYGTEGPINTGIIIPGAVFPPGTPSTAATDDALALVSPSVNAFAGVNGATSATGYSGLSGAGFGLEASRYGLGATGFGLGCTGAFNKFGLKRAGCGCGAAY